MFVLIECIVPLMTRGMDPDPVVHHLAQILATTGFSNKMSSVTPKLVVFNLNIGNPKHEQAMEDGKADRVVSMVNELAESLYGIKREQEYMDVREKTHASSKLPKFRFWVCNG